MKNDCIYFNIATRKRNICNPYFSELNGTRVHNNSKTQPPGAKSLKLTAIFDAKICLTEGAQARTEACGQTLQPIARRRLKALGFEVSSARKMSLRGVNSQRKFGAKMRDVRA